jgi:ribosomal protein L37AE/L43A
MERYNFSIEDIKTVNSGGAPWESGTSGLSFDTTGRWREVGLRIRRDLVCEQCGERFSYTFQVIEQSLSQHGRSTSDYSELTRALEQQVRRKVRCPACGGVQQATRRAFLLRDARHNVVGAAAIGGSLLGALTLAGGGYALAGGWGLAMGSIASMVLMLRLVRWMLGKILS